MYKKGYQYCPPKKKKPKKKFDFKIMGAVMILLGLVTVGVLLLPLKYWVALLSLVLMVCGILLLKK